MNAAAFTLLAGPHYPGKVKTRAQAAKFLAECEELDASQASVEVDTDKTAYAGAGLLADLTAAANAESEPQPAPAAASADVAASVSEADPSERLMEPELAQLAMANHMLRQNLDNLETIWISEDERRQIDEGGRLGSTKVTARVKRYKVGTMARPDG